MTDFIGFKCDSCGNVWTREERTRVTQKFEYTSYCDLGTYFKDLCPKCIVAPFDWTPSKRNQNERLLRSTVCNIE
jgi:hypothetical protein